MKRSRIAVLAAAALAAFSLPAWALNQDLFAPRFGSGQAVSATTTSSSVTLTGEALNDSQIMLTNQGTGVAYCRAGIGAQTATTADMALTSGQTIRLAREGATVVACITASGTATVSVITGNGGY